MRYRIHRAIIGREKQIMENIQGSLFRWERSHPLDAVAGTAGGKGGGMRILDKNTPCPECGTGMCYVKQFFDGRKTYFCVCRRSVWQNEYYETPCPSCAANDARLAEVEVENAAIHSAVGHLR